MKQIHKDQFRKIRANRVNFLSLSLLVVIIAMTFTAVKASVRRLDAKYDSYLESQQLEDFYFAMGNIDLNYLGGSATIELCEELDILFECYYAFSFPNDPSYMNNLNIQINQKIKEEPELYESIVDGFVEEFRDQYDYEVEKNYVVDIVEDEFTYKFVSLTERIDLPYITEGRMPETNHEIAIFPEFAAANDIRIGDTITIRDTTFDVVGFMYKPEYLFPIFSLTSISFDPAHQTLVLATDDAIRNLGEFMFTKYLVRGDLDQILPDYGYTTIQSNDYSFLGRHMQMIYLLMPSDINFRVIALDTEITNANAFIDVFLPLFTGLIAMLLLLFVRRYIQQNKADLDTLHALGYSNAELTRSLMIYPLLVSLTSIIGYGLGLLLSNRLFDTYSARYLFPKAPFVIDADLFLYAVIIPVVTLNVLSFLFIGHALRDRKKQSQRVSLRLFKFIETKTVLSSALLFLTISIMLTFGLSGNSMFSAFVEETKTGNHYTEMINLQYMTTTDHFDTYERYTRVPGKIKEVNSREVKTEQSTTIYGISPQSELKRLIDDDIANNLLLEDGIIVSDFLHTSLGLDVGDEITFDVGGTTVTEVVVGVSNELIENNFYIARDRLNNLFQLDESYYNGLFATDYEYTSPYITSRIDYNTSLEEMAAILNISSLILNYLVVLSVVLSLYIFALILINYFRDHQVEIAVLRSLGYTSFEIHQKYLLVPFILIVTLYLASIPITYWILQYMLSIIMETIGFKLIISISTINMILGFVILLAVFMLIVQQATKFYERLPVASILKHNIK